MATYTAGDQINRALRLLGVLAEGETPSAQESADALTALNQMLDSWNTESLSVYSSTDQTVTWPSGQATRTLGPSGNLPGTNVRPVLVDDSTYFVDPSSGSSYPVKLISRDEYNSIPDKTESGVPVYLFVNMTTPDIELTVYPVPDRALQWHIISAQEIAQIDSLSTVLSLPPGYLRAFTYNLALELAPEFGVQPAADVRRVATVSKRDLKRINSPSDTLSIPSGLVRRGGFDISTGE